MLWFALLVMVVYYLFWCIVFCCSDLTVFALCGSVLCGLCGVYFILDCSPVLILDSLSPVDVMTLAL